MALNPFFWLGGGVLLCKMLINFVIQISTVLTLCSPFDLVWSLVDININIKVSIPISLFVFLIV
jgi:hypothetical protein